MGAYKIEGGGAVVFMNHELGGTPLSEPIVGDSIYRGAFVSRFVLNANAEVLSGELAYDVIVDTAQGVEYLPAQVGNTTPASDLGLQGVLGASSSVVPTTQ